MYKDNATNTVLIQIITMLSCMIVGGIIIIGFTFWTKNWGIKYGDGSDYSFVFGAFLSFLGLFVITKQINLTQFNEALSASEVFEESLIYAFIATKILLIPTAILGIFLLLFGSFWGFIVEILGTAFLLMIIGSIVGSIQFLRLTVTNFDPEKHKLMISEENEIENVKQGVLPYRQQVYLMLQIVGLSLILLIWTIGVWIAFVEAGMFMTLVLGGAILIAGLVQVVEKLELLISKYPRIVTVQGNVSKSMKKEYAPNVGTVRTYYIACGKEKYIADERIWRTIEDGKEYILWITLTRKSTVIAAERC